MPFTKFLWPECNRLFGVEFIDIKFADFGECLVTVFSRYSKTYKKHTFPIGVIGRFIPLVLETQAF